jgi:hypothetical protein
MHHSESLANIGKALAAFQGEVENATKGSTNPAYKSRYADLAEILNTIREPLSKYGLSLVQIPSYENGIASLETMLLHESGEFICGLCSAPVSKQDAQGVGSAITYLRRYCAAAFCGIAQEDDDGNGAVGNAHAGQSQKAAPPKAAPPKADPKPPAQGAVDPAAEADRAKLAAEYRTEKGKARERLLVLLKGDEAEADKTLKDTEELLKGQGAQTADFIKSMKGLAAQVQA